jgi:hypothetical protein
MGDIKRPRRSTQKGVKQVQLVAEELDLSRALSKFLLVVSVRDGVVLQNNRGIRLVSPDEEGGISAEALDGVDHVVILSSKYMSGPIRQSVMRQVQKVKVKSMRVTYSYEQFRDAVAQILRGKSGVTATFATQITLSKRYEGSQADGFKVLAPTDRATHGIANSFSKRPAGQTLEKFLRNEVDIDDYTLPSVIVANKYFSTVVQYYTATTVLAIAQSVRIISKVTFPAGTKDHALYELVRFLVSRTSRTVLDPIKVAKLILPEVRGYYPDLPVRDTTLLAKVSPIVKSVLATPGLKRIP